MVSGYVGFMFAGSVFVLGAAMWNSLFGTQATEFTEVAGITEVPAVLAAEELIAEELIIEEVAPPPEEIFSSNTAQQLSQSLETVPPAPTTGTAGPYVSRGIISNVNITFYDCANQGFCGAMYNGRKVYEGAAACSWNLSIGTRFVIVGDPTHRIYTCEDRGLLANTWVDIFWYYPSQGHSWQGIVGRYGTIEIVSTP